MITRRALCPLVLALGCAHGQGANPYDDWVNVQSYSFSLYTDRQTTQNLFTPLSPQYSTSLNVSYTQPLLRNRGIDAPRQRLIVARKSAQLSESQFRQRVIDTVDVEGTGAG